MLSVDLIDRRIRGAPCGLLQEHFYDAAVVQI